MLDSQKQNPDDSPPPSLWRVIDGGGTSRWFLLGGLTLHAIAQLQILRVIGATLTSGLTEVRAFFGFLLPMVLLHVVFRAQLRLGSERVTTAVSELCDRISQRLLDLDLQEFESLHRAQIRMRLATDRALVGEAGALAVETAASILVAILIALDAFRLSIPGGAVLSAGILLILGSNASLDRHIRAHATEADAQRKNLLHRVWEIIRGFKEIRLHEPRAEAIEEAYRLAAQDTHQRRHKLLSLYYRSDETARSIYYTVLGLLAFLFVKNDYANNGAHLMLSLSFVGASLPWLNFQLPRLSACQAAWLRLQEFDRQLANMTPSHPCEAAPLAFEQLSLVSLGHTFPNSGFACGPIDLTICKGEILFVTGANGSGKSTFLRMLTGLYRSVSGSIEVNGTPIDPANRAAYSELFSVVLTEFAVFPRLYGRENVSPARVEALLDEFGLSEVISYTNGCWSDVRLSTGQRKRLAMIVALLQDRPIYVFDEWAADQDPAFRTEYYQRILPSLRARGKTVIAVTHDEEWFDVADRRIHFEQGRIVP